MKITIKVKPRSKKDRIEKVDKNLKLQKLPQIDFIIYVKAPALHNKANIAIIKSLADYFNVSHSTVRIVSGHKTRIKVIEINTY